MTFIESFWCARSNALSASSTGKIGLVRWCQTAIPQAIQSRHREYPGCTCRGDSTNPVSSAASSEEGISLALRYPHALPFRQHKHGYYHPAWPGGNKYQLPHVKRTSCVIPRSPDFRGTSFNDNARLAASGSMTVIFPAPMMRNAGRWINQLSLPRRVIHFPMTLSAPTAHAMTRAQAFAGSAKVLLIE